MHHKTWLHDHQLLLYLQCSTLACSSPQVLTSSYNFASLQLEIQIKFHHHHHHHQIEGGTIETLSHTRPHHFHPLTGFWLWRQYWRQFWGYIFWGEHNSKKMGPFAPSSATIQALSRTRAFLLSENEQKLLCMGRTFTAARLYLLNNCPFQLSFSWESNPARVKASGRGANFYPRGDY
jgi:hypothetical protein